MIKNMERLSLNGDYSYTEFQLGRGILNYIEVHCSKCNIRMYKTRMMNVFNGLVQENFMCYLCGVIRLTTKKESNGSELS